jgi:hypothetical protein
MLNSLSEISWLGVLLAFIAYFVLGGLWFTVLFGKPYRISLGKENDPPQKPAPIFIIGPAVCCLVITIASATLIHLLNITTWEGMLSFSLIIGVGYLVSNTVNIAINPNMPRPLFYATISGAYHLVGTLIVNTILVFMQQM